MAVPTDVIEQWKEVNANARHWETLVFDNAKGYFTVVALALGGAGAAIGWTSVPGVQQRGAVICFLAASLVLAAMALISISSQKRFLGRLYTRRRFLERHNEGLELRDAPDGRSGWTFVALRGGFWIAIVLSLALLALASTARPQPLLQGAHLQGADLLGSKITQSDLEGACGDANTKLPVGLWVRPCK